MREQSLRFELKKMLKDPDILVQHTLDKFKDIERRNYNRTGPELIWMNELEDSKALVLPSRDFSTGIPTLTRLLMGFESGTSVFAGLSNSGKSTILIQSINDLIELNDDVIVVDLSLDDPASKRYTQLICNISNLDYMRVMNPTSMSEQMVDKYEEGRDKLFERIKARRYFFHESGETVKIGNHKFTANFNTYGMMNEMMEAYREVFPDKKIVITVDSYSDLRSDGGDNSYSKMEMNISEMKNCADANLIKLMVSAHTRKGDGKRAFLDKDDIKGSGALDYNSVFIGMVRNEWRENALSDPLMIERGGKYYPVLTIDVPKNKTSPWNTTWIVGLDPFCCKLIPLTRDEYMEQYAKYSSKRFK